MNVTDQQIDLAITAAMRQAVEREQNPDKRAFMAMELERWSQGDSMPPERLAELRQSIRDFLKAITAPAPSRRRNLPAEQAAAIAERVAQREARKAAKRAGR